MCDYSLMALPNRLATCGEELVVHRFAMGSIGMAPASEIKIVGRPQNPDASVWMRLKKWFSEPVSAPCTAVCIPPGARLRVRDMPPKLQEAFFLDGTAHEVTFTQIGTTGYRDAIRFRNGHEVLLQRLMEGQRVTVLSLSTDDMGESSGIDRVKESAQALNPVR